MTHARNKGIWNRRKGEVKDENEEELNPEMTDIRRDLFDQKAASIMQRLDVSIEEARRMVRNSDDFDI